MKITRIPESALRAEQVAQIAALNAESFGNISQKEAEENFIAKPYARLIAYDGDVPVGTLQLFQRMNTFSGKTFVLGGIGGVCVTASYRRRGIGTFLVREALRVLTAEGCAVACLNTDPSEQAFLLYEKIGFRFMERDASFENSKGQIVHDNGTMFIALNDPDIYHLIQESEETVHYGVGYW